ncbi:MULTISPECIES: NUDIX domain-containing protein [unclassified Roseovarius]|uniref:NUDIX domain-containing protein n=1 Tax=unclassified Roseovarius TaxID=2614913 RepID=UPI00273E2E06|nr:MULTISPECIES: NUDIX domain-containing protein [unclassified Roseovarius]
MTPVFVYGPMAWLPLLTAISGQSLRSVAAELPGHGLSQEGDFGFPTLFPSEGAVKGAILKDFLKDDLSEEAQARISYFAHGLGLGAVTREVLLDGVEVSARVFVPSETGPELVSDWRLEAWQGKWGLMSIMAAEEVGQHFGMNEHDALARMMPMIMVRAAARVAARASAPTDVRSDMGAGHVEIDAQHNRHAGFFLTREFTLRHPLFKGGQSTPVRREVFVATDAAIVLPYDPVRDRVLLVEQFRMGPFGRGDPFPWMLEPVAGRVDPGEPPEDTARRECVEEAGLTLDRLEHVSSHYCSPGCSTEFFHCYVGLCDLPDTRVGAGGLESEDEDIRTHVISFDRAMNLIPSGEAANGPLILCLLWLQRERERLRAGARSGA